MPRVSVIFPAHDREAFLEEAIESILAQTLKDFEFIIIDDGTGPVVSKMLDGYRARDPRVRLIRFPIHLGVNAARNAGLDAATAPLIALMDSDDVALPERLAVQADWLEAHPDVTVCGSLAIKLMPDGRRVAMVYPETDADIKAKLLWVDGALLNPTAMFRTDFVRKHRLYYDASYAIDHDHVFYIAMMRSGASFFSLKQPLLLYRRHAENVTNDDSGQDEVKTAVRTTLLPMFFPELTGTEGQMMLKLLRRSFSVNLREASSAIAAADKAMRETRSFYGESRAGINRILEQQVQVLLAALKRTQFRKPS
jgi:glycosyltransferase involved in cell wall biosynthesis